MTLKKCKNCKKPFDTINNNHLWYCDLCSIPNNCKGGWMRTYWLSLCLLSKTDLLALFWSIKQSAAYVSNIKLNKLKTRLKLINQCYNRKCELNEDSIKA